MNEVRLYEMLGRRSAELEDLRAEYARLLLLLGQVCSGDVAPYRVQVDLAQQAWNLLPEIPAQEDEGEV